MGFCGCWESGHSGGNCPRNTRRTRPATAVSCKWVQAGKLERILHVLAEELQARGKLHLEEAFIDASFTGAKKGASRSGLPNAAKARKSSLLPSSDIYERLLISQRHHGIDFRSSAGRNVARD